MSENGFLHSNKKLVLHFDIRNTLIVADTVTSITVEQALNAYLTGVLWGKEGENDNWEWHSKEPSLTAPGPVSLKTKKDSLLCFLHTNTTVSV